MKRTAALLILIAALSACGGQDKSQEAPERPVDSLTAPVATQAQPQAPSPSEGDPDALKWATQEYITAMFRARIDVVRKYRSHCTASENREIEEGMASAPQWMNMATPIISEVKVTGQTGFVSAIYLAEQPNDVTYTTTPKPEDVWEMHKGAWRPRCS